MLQTGHAAHELPNDHIAKFVDLKVERFSHHPSSDTLTSSLRQDNIHHQHKNHRQDVAVRFRWQFRLMSATEFVGPTRRSVPQVPGANNKMDFVPLATYIDKEARSGPPSAYHTAANTSSPRASTLTTTTRTTITDIDSISIRQDLLSRSFSLDTSRAWAGSSSSTCTRARSRARTTLGNRHHIHYEVNVSAETFKDARNQKEASKHSSSNQHRPP